MKAVLLLPARNEQETIQQVLDDLRAALAELVDEVDAIVVDDQSADQTPDLAKRAGAVVTHPPEGESGLAAAFRTGIAEARKLGPDFIVHADSDGQHTAAAVRLVAERWLDRGGLVLGNRLWGVPEGMSDLKYWWNLYLTELVSFVAGTPVRDSQTGLRAFDLGLAESAPITSTHTYTQEQVIRAAKRGYAMESVDIPYRKRVSGHSRLINSPFRYLERVMGDLDRLSVEFGVDPRSAGYVRDPRLIP